MGTLMALMDRLVFLLVLVAALSGCPSGDELDDLTGSSTDAGVAVATRNCGAPISERVMNPQCTEFSDCGGAGNIVTTFDCEGCPRQAAFQICATGQCRTTGPTAPIRATFEAPLTTTGARSIITLAYSDVAADGTALTCEGLLSAGCDRLGDEALPLTNANILEPIGGINDAAPNFFTPILAEVGTDRVVLVFITTAQNGAGEVRAVGCADGLSVTSGMTTEVQLEMKSGPF